MNDSDKLIITQHCAERYAERIMARSERSDVAVYVAQNKEKIEEDINKLYTYGTFIYSGQLKDRNPVKVYLKDTWILLVDMDGKRAITLYKVDLGLDDDFNKDFIQRTMELISSRRAKYNEKQDAIIEEKKGYKTAIEEMTAEVNEYRRRVKNLEMQISAYEDIINTMDDKACALGDEYRQAVLTLIGKKEF